MASKGSAPATTVKVDTTKLPPVPETILKRKKRAEVKVQQQREKLAAYKKQKVASRKSAFKKAETYLREYRQQVKEEIRLKRQAKAQGNFYVPPEPKVAFVIRIRGINQLSPKPKKVLQLLRLRQINNGVFVKLNAATIPMLRLVEPYITFGYPSVATIRSLVYKRGYAKVAGQRTPITSNAIIENVLGKYGITCMEDIIHEITTCGKNFRKVTNFLWPFKLNPARGGFKKVTRPFTEGGDFGNREELINKLVKRML